MRTAGSIFVFQRGEEGFLFWGPVVWRGGPLAGEASEKRCSYKKAKSILSGPQDSVFFREITRYGRGLETADAGP
jgi:hypothetical protein